MNPSEGFLPHPPPNLLNRVENALQKRQSQKYLKFERIDSSSPSFAQHNLTDFGFYGGRNYQRPLLRTERGQHSIRLHETHGFQRDASS